MGNHVAGAAFAASALGGNAQFKLNLVKAHARMRVACNFTVRDSTAYTNDHGGKQLLLAMKRIGEL